MSRFMLNLQAVSNQTMRLGSGSGTQGDDAGRVSSLLFNERVLGSLGSSAISDPRESQAQDEDPDDVMPPQ